MAIADILGRIGTDAEGEAATIMADAERETQRVVAEARAEADRDAVLVVERAAVRAAADADTMRATARLRARDRLLAVRREFVDRALTEVETAMVALPDERYAALLAAAAVRAARGGETVRVAAADAARASAIRGAVERAAPDLVLEWSGEPADVDRGVVLAGDRVRAEVSAASLVEERREDLALIVAQVLFGEASEE
ncbi:MAG: hypothetical protein C0418_00265 [Coriobacteriaceae bacterium]|nr:hypothetical protein [Coriobacteriaceae bacterium]